MAKKLVNKNYITPKKARAIFIKFLMENNCYKEYVICYRGQYNRKNYTPSQIFDTVINKLGDYGGRLSVALLCASFGWASSSRDLYKINNKKLGCEYAYQYWDKLSIKLIKKYEGYYIREDKYLFGILK